MSNLFPLIDELTPWLEQKASERPPLVGGWLLSVYRNWCKSHLCLVAVKKAAPADNDPAKYLRGPQAQELLIGTVKASGVVAFRSLPPDAVKAVSNGATLIQVKSTPKQEQALSHMLDFMCMYAAKNPDKDLSRISVPQLAAMTIEWDKELHRIKEAEALNAGSALIYRCPEGTALAGWTVHVISSVEAIQREGERMGNCLQSNAVQYASSRAAIFSVRNEAGKSVASAEVSVKFGALNSVPTMLYFVR